MTELPPEEKPIPVFPEEDESNRQPEPAPAAASPEPGAPTAGLDPGAGTAEDEPRPRVSRRLKIALAAVIVIGGAGSVIRLPYIAIGPGSTKDILGAVSIAGGARTYPSSGKLLITTVAPSGRTLTVWETLVVWIHPTLTTAPPTVVYDSRLTRKQQEQLYQMQMTESKRHAEIAAFRHLGLLRFRRGARVVQVAPGSSADGKLAPGDVIVEVNGNSIEDNSEAVALIREASGRRLTIVFRRDGKRHQTRLRARPMEPGGRPMLGVLLDRPPRVPYPVKIDSARIGGPSGGLVFALSLVELLTEEDLTRGRTIAVTGAINEFGDVGRIGGITQKVQAAVRDRATAFIMPEAEVAEAAAVAPPSLRIIGVRTLEEAVDALRSLSATA